MNQVNDFFNVNRIIKIVGIVLGVLLGITVGFLYFFNLLPTFATTIFFIFGISILVLILYFISIYITEKPNCDQRRILLKNSGYILFSILGTIISTLIAISIVFAPAIIFSAILAAIITFFFILVLSSIVLIAYSLLIG